MQGINKVILVGNLGKAPEVKALADGTPVARMYLATTESYRGKAGERTTKTQWHTIIAWRALATLAASYLHKGSLLYIEGRLNQRSYTNKEGVVLWVTEIVADKLLLLDKKLPGQEVPAADSNALPF